MMAVPADEPTNSHIDFLEAVLGDEPDGPLSLFSIDTETGNRITDWAATPTELYRIAQHRAPRCNVWFGVAPRTHRTGSRRGTAADCTTIGALWADLDIIGPGHARTDLIPTLDDAYLLVESFGQLPTAVLETGGGLQAWWALAERLPVDQADDILARFGAWWVAAGEQHGWHIDNVWDPARVLRVPGTQNRKTGDVADIEITVWNPDHRYGLDDFDWLPDPPAPTYNTKAEDRVPYIGPERPGDHFNAQHTCGQVLEAHGWTFDHKDRGTGDEHWVRPGKPKNQGTSGTVYAADGHFINWSESVPQLAIRRSYDPFGLYVAIRHGGDFQAAGRDLGARGYGERPVDDSLAWLIDGLGKADSAVEVEEYHGPPDDQLWVEGCDERAWPAIDPAAWRGPLGQVVREIEPHSETDPVAIGLELMVALGNCIGSGPHAVADGSNHPARIFGCLVGKTAKGRKGSAAAQASRVMAHVDRRWATTRTVNGIASGEALIAAVSAPVADLDADAPGTMVDHRAFIRESEFARFLTIANREGSTLSAVVRDAWDTGQLAITARINPVRAEDAHVSISGHITAEELRAKLTATDAANGLLNRFLFVLVQRSKRLPTGGALEEKDYAALGGLFAPVVEQARKSGLMVRTKDAEAYWAGVYDELGDDDPPGLVGQLVARAEPHTLRLSVLFALLDGRRVIDVSHIEQAYAWWRYCRASVEYLFAGLSFSPDAVKLLGALRDAGRQGLTYGEQHAVFNRNRSGSDLGRMRAELAAGGVVWSDERGRDKRSWAVRPASSIPPTTLLDSSDSSDS